ncbi:MAG: VOC family protein [Bacteroidota bacterium]
MRFAHTNIVSTDWKRLVDFYVATFACQVLPPLRKQSGAWLDRGTGMRNAYLEGAHLRLPGYDNDGPTLEIYQYRTVVETDAPPPNRQGLGHLAFEVTNVATLLEQVIQNGGQACGKLTEKDVAGVGRLTFVYARDPEGNLLELQHWDHSSPAAINTPK